MNKTYDHLMIDIETVSSDNDAAILSIAAVPFNMDTGRYDKKDFFYEVIDLQSCFDKGLKASGSTIEWWFKQNTKARMAALGLGLSEETVKSKIPINSALNKLNSFMHTYQNYQNNSKDGIKITFKVWGNGARFDLGVLGNAYKACGLKHGWHYRGERDVRTLMNILPASGKKADFKGTRHDPVDDCIHQIKYCSKMWRRINGKQTKQKTVTEKATKTTPRKKKLLVISDDRGRISGAATQM